MAKGYLALVLHAHLPYVRHPEHSDSFEEQWLNEAISDTYLPLLSTLDRLASDDVDYRLTISISPTLMEMLRDPLLMQRYEKRLETMQELSERELVRTHADERFAPVARLYQRQWRLALERFTKTYDRDILGGFIALQEAGRIELITTAATHAFLPAYATHESAVRAQVATAVKCYEKHVGRRPPGFWLPECGYYAGLDSVLREMGIRYFFLESHGLLYGNPRPRYGTYAPVITPGGAAAFGRDMSASKQVWSSREGYPGDYDYREYYRDIGYDLPLDDVAPYIHESGQRTATGFKYYRITGAGDHKEPYVPEWATEKAAIHAGNFIFSRQRQAEHLEGLYGKAPVIVAPYDAELFGHWWYEGPQWLNFLLRKLHFDQEGLALTTPGEYLDAFPNNQTLIPNPSSWGLQGYNEYWLNPSNDWIYRHLHRACERMVDLANHFPSPSDLQRRGLNQAERELFLAMSSDWAFIMKTGTHLDYAVQRTTEHLLNFQRLDASLTSGNLAEDTVRELEKRHGVFSDLNYQDFTSRAALVG